MIYENIIRHYVKLNWAWCQGKMNKCTYMYSTRQTWRGEMGGDSIGRWGDNISVSVRSFRRADVCDYVVLLVLLQIIFE